MGALHVALAIKALALKEDTCSHCGKNGAGFQRCSRCKKASYCGVECQKSGWKRHKKAGCAPPLPMAEVRKRVDVAYEAGDWQGVLKLEGRMEELFIGQTDAYCDYHLHVFSRSHELGKASSRDHALSVILLEERRIGLLETMERFRDQGSVMCTIGNHLLLLNRVDEAGTYFKRARDLGAQHGFLSVECDACLGLGALAAYEGRMQEGLDLLRNALAAADLAESDEQQFQLNTLRLLIPLLFDPSTMGELEPLVVRYQKAAEAYSRKRGRLDFMELQSRLYCARLHEVLCTCTLLYYSRS